MVESVIALTGYLFEVAVSVLAVSVLEITGYFRARYRPGAFFILWGIETFHWEFAVKKFFRSVKQ